MDSFRMQLTPQSNLKFCMFSITDFSGLKQNCFRFLFVYLFVGTPFWRSGRNHQNHSDKYESVPKPTLEWKHPTTDR